MPFCNEKLKIIAKGLQMVSEVLFLLYDYQSGFIRGHSTVYQLLEMYHRVCQNLDERLSTILIFCDISKTFDRVWHEGLIKKLKSYAISGDLLIWFKNYLSGRRQFVFVNNELSDSDLVKAGVPQGSVLGPLLFLLCINDITDNLGNLARLFADDTSLSYSGENFDLMQIEINNDSQILDQWVKTWLYVQSSFHQIQMLHPDVYDYQQVQLIRH
jgi:hypothetical protein